MTLKMLTKISDGRASRIWDLGGSRGEGRGLEVGGDGRRVWNFDEGVKGFAKIFWLSSCLLCINLG